MGKSLFTKCLIICVLLFFSLLFFGDGVKAYDENFSASVLEMIKRNETENIDLTNPYQTKRLLVKSSFDIDLMGAIEKVSNEDYHVLQYDSEENVKNAYEYYSGLDYIEYVEMDAIFKAENVNYTSWGAKDMGIKSYTDYLLEEIGSTSLEEVVIAVLDTGIDSDHSWFKDRIISGGRNYSSSISSTNVVYEDVHGHGTHVSGIIVDLTLNNVKILPIKVMNDQGYGYASTVALGIDYVTSLKNSGLNIGALNLSLGSKSSIGSQSYKTYSSSLQKAYSAGVLPIVAAGNDGINVANYTPANIENVITVSAVAKSNNTYYHPTWSNYGSYIDVSAPGKDIVSAAVGGGTVAMSGTSMAAPHVSAAVALLCSDNEANYSLNDIENILYDSSIDLGDNGWDKYYGEGMVNLEYAYAKVIEPVSFSNTIRDHIAPFTITLSTNESDAIIYYTTNGTVPSLTNGTKYNGPISIYNTMEIQAKAYVLSSSGRILKYSKTNSFTYYFYGDDTSDSYTISNDGTLLSYTGSLTELTIPKTINNITVLKIGSYAFSNTNITKITLSSTVIEIDEYAFYNLKTLQEIYAPSVTKIGMYAFYECSYLKGVNDFNFPQLLEIGKYAFYNCYNLNSINLSKVTLIDYYAFAMNNCESQNLKSISMPSVKIVSEGAFIYNKYLTKIDFPNVEVIASNAFRDCDISDLYLPLVKYLGNYSFYSNDNLLIIDAPSVEIIGDYSFYLCNKIYSINIEKVKKIGESSFREIKNFEYINVPFVEEIGAYAFYNCDKLKEINVKNLKVINYAAFANIESLEKINLESIEKISNKAFENDINLKEVYLSSNIIDIKLDSFNNINEEVIFYIYRGTTSQDFAIKNNYLYIDLLSEEDFIYEINNKEITLKGYKGNLNKEIVIPSYIGNLPVTKIASYAFSNANNIYSLKSSTLKEIENNAFENCSNLIEIYLPKTIIINSNAFLNCFNLEYVELLVVREVGTKAFYGCESLITIELPNTIENIGEKAFGYNGEDKVIPSFKIYAYENSVSHNYANKESIEIEFVFLTIPHFYYNYYFNNGRQDIYITFVDSHLYGNLIIPGKYNNYVISKIGDSAFKNCSLITSIVLPSSIKYIDDHAFENCSSLESINLNYVESIGASSFKNCNSLKSINLDLVTQILEETFANNNSLIIANIPNTVVIKDKAFTNCYNLEKVISPSLQSIGWEAFSYNYNLKEIDTKNIKVLGVIDSRNIKGEVFIHCTSLKEMYLPSIETMGENIFMYSSLEKIAIGRNFSSYIKNPISKNDNIQIYGYRGTLIEEYCYENNLEFIEIEELNIIKDLDDEKIIKGVLSNDLIEIEVKGLNLQYKWYEIEGSTVKEIENNSNVLPLETESFNKSYYVRIIDWEGNYIDSNICKIIFIEAELYNISTVVLGKGRVNPGENIIVVEGDSLIVSFISDYGYELTEVVIDRVLINELELIGIKENGYIFNNVVENHTIKATFNKKKFTIEVSKEGEGEISPNGLIKVEYQQNQTFTIEAYKYHHVEDILIDGNKLTKEEILKVKEEGYTFENVEKNHTLKVVFAIDVYVIEVLVNGKGSVLPNERIEVEHGSSKHIRFIADSGYIISKIIIDEWELTKDELLTVINNGYRFEYVKNDHRIEVVFDKIKYIVNASKEGEGNISPSGNIIVEHGENKRFLFIPSNGYKVGKILIDGYELVKEKLLEAIEFGYTFTNVIDAHTIKVIFEKKQYTIDASSNIGGSIEPSGVISVEHGESPRFIIKNNDYYHIDKIIVDSTILTKDEIDRAVNEGYSFKEVECSHVIQVVFSIDKHLIVASVEGNGEISPSGNIYVDHNDNKTFTFTANEGYKISKIIVDKVELKEVKEYYTISNIIKNHTIKVVFEKITFTISSFSSGEGDVYLNGEIVAEYGSTKTFKFIPKEGYELSSVIIDNFELNEKQLEEAKYKGYTFTFITSDHVISAKFKKKIYSIQIVSEGSGSVIPNGNVFVEHGGSQNILIIPEINHHVKEIKIDNNTLAKESINLIVKEGYTFTNIIRNHSIKVVFEIDSYLIETTISKGNSILTSSEKVKYGDDYFVELAKEEGYFISKIKIDDVILSKTNMDIVIKEGYAFNNIKSNHKIEVTLEKIVDKIIASVIGDGSINPSGEIIVKKGQNYLFNFTASKGSYISNVLVDGESKGNITNYIFKNVEGIHEITVIFAKEKFKINVEIIGEGTVDCEDSLEEIEYGDSRVFKINPKDNYKIDKVIVNGKETIIEDDTLNISKVTSNINISIVFVEEKGDDAPGLSCSKNGEGSIMDFLFIIFSMFFVVVPKKRLMKL